MIKKAILWIYIAIGVLSLVTLPAAALYGLWGNAVLALKIIATAILIFIIVSSTIHSVDKWAGK